MIAAPPMTRTAVARVPNCQRVDSRRPRTRPAGAAFAAAGAAVATGAVAAGGAVATGGGGVAFGGAVAIGGAKLFDGVMSSSGVRPGGTTAAEIKVRSAGSPQCGHTPSHPSISRAH